MDQLRKLLRKLFLLKFYLTRFVPLRKAKYFFIGAVFILLLYLLTYNDTVKVSREQAYDEEQRLAEAMLSEKGTGCDVPSIDPFTNNVIAEYEKEQLPRPKCKGPDWVQCYLSQCKVIEAILNKTRNLKCTYQDIIYVTDWTFDLGEPMIVAGDAPYTLERSDHVKVSCTGTDSRLHTAVGWSGLKVGFRNPPRPEVPKGREKYPNILLFAFDSTSKNAFVRKMPKSYKILTEKYESVVLNKYNIVGDGTVATLLGFLVGKTELELPELRKNFKSNSTLEDVEFFFSLLREYGYRTAYFEDAPTIGTFNYRLKGFMKQPTHHYLRALYMSFDNQSEGFCSGDRLRYSVMIDLTRQFYKLPGHKFIFTFVSDITHDDGRPMKWADDEFSQFLMELLDNGVLKNTAVFVMGDHGPRFAEFRHTYEGKMEERLPLMAIRLPDNLHKSRENVAITANRDTLTTPFDIHTTLLHLTGLEEYKNKYKVPGADMLRGNNLMEMISPNRSCAEAGVLAHWCVCLQWRHLADSDPMYRRVAESFRNYVNSLTTNFRDRCALRTLKSVKWVTIKQNRKAMLAFEESADMDGFVPKLKQKPQLMQDYYQIQVELGPSSGWYEATASYSHATGQLSFNERDVSRINAYGDEPKCIVNSSPNLVKYCYCY